MQIKSITLYNPSGEKRTLSFKLGQVNIITGRSSRGKSAIIEIIEYCLGHSSFKVPEGIIRDAVAWYSLLLQINQTQIFIAKPKPPINRGSQNKVYYESGSEITIPDLVQLVPNSNDDAIITELSHLIGISPNQTIVEDNNSRVQFEATIKHTSYYLFQKQSIVANKNTLFHRQEEQWIPQAIKDTLPYFLGAIQEDRLKLEKELSS
jgi:energy-coupling factor transporter ATP-binding protein EcfA2